MGRDIYNCIVVLGPTAVGKTSIGVRLAYAFGGEIISADSRQTYKGLDIGSGKDLSEYEVEGKKIPFHLIDIVDLDREYTVYDYQQDFYPIFDSLINRKVLPVIVGGTGFYLDAVIRGYDLLSVPENPKFHAELELKSLDELVSILLKFKPDYHQKSDFKIKKRLIKAIEIAAFEASSDAEIVRAKMYKRPDIRPLVLGTTFEREKVRENISIRLKERLDCGLIEEVQALHENGVSWQRLESLGLEYRFCSEFLQGKIMDKSVLFERLNIAIRQFAKRQETWFRWMEVHGVKIIWLPPVQDKNLRIQAALAEAGKYF